MKTEPVATFFEWTGGEDALMTLVVEFYRRVQQDSILAPVFATMGPGHPAHVAAFTGAALWPRG
jgi:hemoglobin